MVLTDGSTQYPKKVFEDRNPDKQVIDFAFLQHLAREMAVTLRTTTRVMLRGAVSVPIVLVIS